MGNHMSPRGGETASSTTRPRTEATTRALVEQNRVHRTVFEPCVLSLRHPWATDDWKAQTLFHLAVRAAILFPTDERLLARLSKKQKKRTACDEEDRGKARQYRELAEGLPSALAIIYERERVTGDAAAGALAAYRRPVSPEELPVSDITVSAAALAPSLPKMHVSEEGTPWVKYLLFACAPDENETSMADEDIWVRIYIHDALCVLVSEVRKVAAAAAPV